ncbi:hypothetical protein KPL78_08695 [Roseomonas sp. HJA6]|uniref:Uncharacterized protein n=1 Tax=Roseomonas alba TaxID=2846776 RepID=A0ABS7A739_9PROT|nr:hypothetical protein [Neoroseomonas alba]MBW6397920.1 hypothetical protein [Neoroseomonas alba]
MSSNLVAVLHQEERTIVAELRASRPFQRLEAIRRLLALYGEQPSIAAGLDAPAEAERGSGEVIHFAAVPAAAPPAPGTAAIQAVVHAAVAASSAPAPAPAPVAAASMPAVSAIPMPGPAAGAPAAAPAAATNVAAITEAAVADVVMRSPAPSGPAQKTEAEPVSVVSSVRAALLGIGKS